MFINEPTFIFCPIMCINPTMEYFYIGQTLRLAETFDSNPKTAHRKTTPLVKTLRKTKRALGFVAFLAIGLIALFIPLTVWMLGIYLAYNCYRGHPTQQVLGVVVAVLLPLCYLLFYFVVHLMLRVPCASSSVNPP